MTKLGRIGRRRIDAYTISVEKPEGIIIFEELVIDGTVMLKGIPRLLQEGVEGVT
jgi:hypothetical protein